MVHRVVCDGMEGISGAKNLQSISLLELFFDQKGAKIR